MSDRFEEQDFEDLTIRIDRDRCIGTGNCVAVAPEIFELGPDRIVTLRPDARAIERERMIEACAVCPVEALRVTDPDGNQLVP